MAENSKIEWTTHTFNPWIGCQKVSPGCDHCYAENMMATRYKRVEWGPHGERIRTSAAYWRRPHAWNREANTYSARPRVFCASLADVFDNQAPTGARADLFNLIRATPELDWLLLTKRPENIAGMLPDAESWGPTGWPNVWLGTTCEDQKNYDRRWPILRAVPAKVHFISYEPAIGALRIQHMPKPGWLICGGESGHGHRDMPVEWAEQIKRDCEIMRVPFFMKQMAGKRPVPPELMLRQFPA